MMMLETAAFVYLCLCCLGALALVIRMPSEFKKARGWGRQRILGMQIVQGFRRASRAVLSATGWEKTLERMRLF